MFLTLFLLKISQQLLVRCEVYIWMERSLAQWKKRPFTCTCNCCFNWAHCTRTKCQINLRHWWDNNNNNYRERTLYNEPQMEGVGRSCSNLLVEPSWLVSICKKRKSEILKSNYAYVCTLNCPVLQLSLGESFVLLLLLSKFRGLFSVGCKTE